MNTLILKTDPRRTGILAAIVATHAAVIILFLISPALHPKASEKPVTDPPVPLQIAVMELMQTPAAVPASPPPAGQPMATPQATHTPPAATPTPAPSKPVATPMHSPAPQATPQIQPAPAKPVPVASPTTATSERGITDAASPPAISSPSNSRSAATSSGASSVSQGASGTSNSNSPPRFGAAYLNNPAPKYPAMAKRLGEEGRVLLRVLVSPDGLAKDIRLHASSGSNLLDDSAIKAVRRWRFIPAKQGDSSVEAWVQVPIVFKLD